jgi:hypothetical protein
MKKTDAAWLAGLLEGEGCFRQYAGTGNGRARYQVILKMTDLDVVERAARITNNSNRIRPGQISSIRHKPIWTLTWYGQAAEDVSRAVLPHMGKRRKERIESILAMDLSHRKKNA